MLLTIAAFVFVLGVLIFVHELGHFLAAKASGIGVPRFSIGFGPATPLRFRRGETEYVVSWFPLGGYVKMASREEQEAMGALEGGATGEEYPADKLFENKPLAARIVVLSAGVAMNALFAWFVYAALAGVYGRAEDPTTRLARVDATALPAAAEALAAVPSGTRIVRLNGDTVRSWTQLGRQLIDPRSAALRFEFAGGVEAVTVAIPGTDARERAALIEALKPMWRPTIGGLAPGFPAANAGLEPGDRIVAVNGDSIRVWDDLNQIVDVSAGDTLQLAVLRADSSFVVPIVPVEQTDRDPVTGQARKVGRIGIGPQIEPIRVRYGFVEAIAEGGRQTLDMTSQVLFTIKSMFTGQVSVRELGGPILIGQVSGQAAEAGLPALLGFMAFLSINLAILNLLPIPVLDGGHLVFLLIEGVRGKPLSLDVRLKLTQFGLAVIVGIMVLAFANDFLRLLGG